MIAYLVHKYQNQVHHLAVISVAKKGILDRFNVPVTTLFRKNETKKIMVCDVEDILTLTGLVRFNNHSNEFKVI